MSRFSPHRFVFVFGSGLVPDLIPYLSLRAGPTGRATGWPAPVANVECIDVVLPVAPFVRFSYDQVRCVAFTCVGTRAVVNGTSTRQGLVHRSDFAAGVRRTKVDSGFEFLRVQFEKVALEELSNLTHLHVFGGSALKCATPFLSV